MKLKLLIIGLLGWVCALLVTCSNNQPHLSPLHAGDTILAFGDSLTEGVGAREDESYPSILQRLSGYTVINAGVAGEETSQGLQRISAELEKYQPKLVLLCFGGNDMLRKRPNQQTKENLKQIILKIKQANAEVVLVGVPRPSLGLQIPEFYQELGDELQIPVEKVSLSVLLGTHEMKSDHIHLNALGYKQLAQDVYDFLKQQGAFDQE